MTVEEHYVRDAGKFYVEEKVDGFHVQIHKHGGSIKVVTEEGNNVRHIDKYEKQLLSALPVDYIIDGEMIPYIGDESQGRRGAFKYTTSEGNPPENMHLRFVVWDIIKYDHQDLRDKPLSHRKSILEHLNENEVIKRVPGSLVEADSTKLKSAIKKYSEPEYSEGAVVKGADTKYVSGDSKMWAKYRKLEDIDAVVLKVNHVHEGEKTYNYTVGINVDKLHRDRMDESHMANDVLILGNTFNTSKVAKEGDIIHIKVEEIWRHVDEKDHKIHYSIHKPHVSDIGGTNTSTVQELDKMVVGRGVEVQEMAAIREEGEFDTDISNFPKDVQSAFNSTKGKWHPFVIQHHYRGSKEGSLNSLHTDMRFQVGDSLQGFTLFTPGSTGGPDVLTSSSPKATGGIRCTVKRPEPSGWLHVNSFIEKGKPGSSRRGADYYAPGVMLIVGEGEFRTVLAEDHRIIFQLKCKRLSVDKSPLEKAKKEGIQVRDNSPDRMKELNGYWEAQIAHIGDHHVILFKKLKNESAFREHDNWMRELTKNSIISMEKIIQMDSMFSKGAGLNETIRAVELSNQTVNKYRGLLGYT